MSTSLKVTAKGQVTLRKEILKHLGVAPGEKIDIDLLPGGSFVARADRLRRTGSIENVYGMLASENGPTLTIEEIGEAAAAGWASAMDYEKDVER